MDKGTNAHHQSLTNDYYGMTFVAATVQHVVFKDTSRMSKASFDKLLLFIRSDLEVDASRARCCGGIILPELSLYCTLQYCVGGLYSDIKNFTSISTASFYRVVWKCIDAINKRPKLAIIFPQTRDKVHQAAKGFTSISSQG